MSSNEASVAIHFCLCNQILQFTIPTLKRPEFTRERETAEMMDINAAWVPQYCLLMLTTFIKSCLIPENNGISFIHAFVKVSQPALFT